MKKNLTTLFAILAGIILIAVSACSNENKGTGGGNPIQAGAKIYEQNCKSCHGAGAKGDICPNLTDAEWKYGSSDKDVYTSIAKGRPGGMPAWESTLGEKKIRQVMAYIRSLGK
jgi:cytochrome c oxidase cbb3-type subunit 3